MVQIDPVMGVCVSEMVIYKIGDIYVSLNIGIKCWEKFQVFSNSDIDINIEILDSIQQYYEIEFIQIPSSAQICLRYGSDIMFADESYKNIYIFSTANIENIMIFLIQAYHSYAIIHQRLHFHSSLIDHRGHGLMFLGPSGIGKTTQAELWNKYRESLIINGDMVFVQETDDGFLGWGTPWHGSSPYCENTSVPLKAMIVLKQAPENSIRELTGFEKVTEVSNSVFYPQWLENGMELCLETLDHLLTRIPVYELSCRPDEDAVRLAVEAVFGSCG